MVYYAFRNHPHSAAGLATLGAAGFGVPVASLLALVSHGVTVSDKRIVFTFEQGVLKV